MRYPTVVFLLFSVASLNQTVFADLVSDFGNGDFENALILMGSSSASAPDDIVSSSDLNGRYGNWIMGNITTNTAGSAHAYDIGVVTSSELPGGPSNVLEHRTFGNGAAPEQNVRQFLDANGHGGEYELTFDWEKVISPSLVSNAFLRVAVYGIEDPGNDGWTASPGFFNGVHFSNGQSSASLPSITGATLHTLTDINTGAIYQESGYGEHLGETYTFSLGDGTTYDTIVIDVLSNGHNPHSNSTLAGSRAVNLIDNFSLSQTATAVPEPSSLV